MRMQSVGSTTVVIINFRMFVCDQINDTSSTHTMINLGLSSVSTDATIVGSRGFLTAPLSKQLHASNTQNETTGPQTTTPIPNPLSQPSKICHPTSNRPTTPHPPPNLRLVAPSPRLVHVDALGLHLRLRRSEQPRQQRLVGGDEYQTFQYCEQAGGD